MDIETFVASLDDSRVRFVHKSQWRKARFADLSQPITEPLATRLRDRGIERLWAHQVEALERIRRRENTVIATGTSSGKSLCYLVPVLTAAMGRGTSFLVFPTKALAQDQLRSIRELTLPGVTSAAYDGDTPDADRAWIRRGANVVVTNPDMLHFGILPNHDKWANFFKRLEFVVIDELHTLRGVFGSNVANVIRRLRRIAAHYGTDPVFILSSATIGKPEELATKIVGEPVGLVSNDASPSGRRWFVVWEAPEIDGSRLSAHVESARLLADLVESGFKAIAFTRSRRGAEVVAQQAKKSLGKAFARRVDSYRGGYLAEERRELERRLFSGDLDGIAATNALELGIDVGGLDACVLDGFPGTIASTRQQAGRAGRRLQDSLAILVGGEDQLDRWYLEHPEELVRRSPEPGVVNPSNPYILRAHLGCAAAELPLRTEDIDLFGYESEELAAQMVSEGELRTRSGRLWWAKGRPALKGLRTSGMHPFRILDVDDRRLVGTEDGERVCLNLHPGAVYLHKGETYKVVDLDFDNAEAWVEPTDADYYTMAREDTDIEVVEVERSKRIGKSRLRLGRVLVTEQVTGFKKVRGGRVIGYGELDLPPQELETRAFWLEVPDSALAEVPETRVLGTMHAIEHASIGVLPLFLICDRWDIGGVSMAAAPDTGLASSFIYDGYPGGVGIADMGFDMGRRHLEATLEVIRTCSCEDGCPSCIQSPKCGNWNEPLEKAGAIAVLTHILGAA